MSINVQEMTKAVLDDKELMDKLEKANNSQEVSDLLATKNILIRPDTIDEFMESQLKEGELDEKNLENVVGGFKLRYLNPFYWVGRLLAWGITKDMC